MEAALPDEMSRNEVRVEFRKLAEDGHKRKGPKEACGIPGYTPEWSGV